MDGVSGANPGLGQIIGYKTVLRVRKTAGFATVVFYFGGNDPPVAKLLPVFGECGVKPGWSDRIAGIAGAATQPTGQQIQYSNIATTTDSG